MSEIKRIIGPDGVIKETKICFDHKENELNKADVKKITDEVKKIVKEELKDINLSITPHKKRKTISRTRTLKLNKKNEVNIEVILINDTEMKKELLAESFDTCDDCNKNLKNRDLYYCKNCFLNYCNECVKIRNDKNICYGCSPLSPEDD